jgi:hypothetical protein
MWSLTICGCEIKGQGGDWVLEGEKRMEGTVLG